MLIKRKPHAYVAKLRPFPLIDVTGGTESRTALTASNACRPIVWNTDAADYHARAQV